MARDRRTRRGPGRPPASELAVGERRGQILEAASQCFSRLGYGGASIGDIATVAGVSKATLLHHFGSKEALFAATMQFGLEAIAAAIRHIVDGPGTVRERLFHLAEVAIVLLEGDADLGGWVRDAEEHLSASERDHVREVHRAVLQEVEAAMREGIALGELADADPRLLAHAFWSILGGFGGRQGTAAGFQGRPEIARAVVALFLGGAGSASPNTDRQSNL